MDAESVQSEPAAEHDTGGPIRDRRHEPDLEALVYAEGPTASSRPSSTT